MGTVQFHPLQEEDLLQGQVEEGVLKVPLEDVVVLVVLQLQELVQPLFLKHGARRSRDEDPSNPHTIVQSLLGPSIP